MNILIDNCIRNEGTHYDIALYIYELLKNKNKLLFQSIKNNDEIDDKIKQKELKKIYENKLKTEIKGTIVNKFIERSFYWNENNENIKANILIEIANKLKKDNFIKGIIKELRQFY